MIRYIADVPLKLHPECRRHILVALTERLPKLSIDSGMFWGDDSFAILEDLDRILPKDAGEIGLQGQFSDQPLQHFVYEVISRELRQLNQYKSGSKPLTELPSYVDSSAAAERLIRAFETLPWHYQLFVRSNVPSDYESLLGERSTDLGGTLKLFLPSQETSQNSTYRLSSNKAMQSC